MGDLMKHIQDLQFMKLANVFAMHNFWNIQNPNQKEYIVVHNEKEVHPSQFPNVEIVALNQIHDLPFSGSDIRVTLTPMVTGMLFYQAKSAIEYLLDCHHQILKSVSQTQHEMKLKIRAEEDAHIKSAQKFADQVNLLNDQIKHMEKTIDILAKENKKNEIVMSDNKTLTRKKKLLSVLQEENEELKRVNEGLKLQLQSYGHDEDLT